MKARGNFYSGRLRSVILASAALASVTYCLLVALAPPEPVPVQFSMGDAASWITTQETRQSSGCFRLDLPIRARVVNAWVSVAAKGGYQILVNGALCAQYSLLRTPQHFQGGLSQSGQKLTPSYSAIALRYPQYQWSDHNNAELPTWIDLTSVLRLGLNAICVEVESTDKTPAFILTGEVLLETGERIPIRSGIDWSAEPVPTSAPRENWTLPELPVLNWNHAKALPWKGSFWRLVPPGVYQGVFRGKRIRWAASDSVSWMEQDWNLAQRPAEAFLRVATDSLFQVWINGRRIQVNTPARSIFAAGPWFVQGISRTALGSELEMQPERLDLDDIATLLPGQHEKDLQPSDPIRNNQTPSKMSPAAIEKRIVPLALGRDRRNVEFLAFSITPLLRPGSNTIRIGMYPDEPEAVGSSWRPMLAFDGAARMVDGQEAWLASGNETRSFPGTLLKETPASQPFAQVDGSFEPKLLPAKRFLGCVYPDRPWFALSLGLFFLSAGVLSVATARSLRLRLSLQEHQNAFAVLAGWLGAGLLLRSTMAEQSEALFWRLPALSWLLLGFGLFGAALAIVLPVLSQGRLQISEIEQPPSNCRKFRNRLRVWALCTSLTLMLCFAVRAWQIDAYPIDDDEYASIQAVTAIAAKGVPEYLEGVWYTRSPLYHYLAGGVAWISGGNIFALRLLSVFFACGTALVLWKLCQELTRSRLLALVALLLYAIHPYLAFTGHVARFYQQQQFFHLLALCFFLRGFIANSGMRDRYLAVAAFCAAALSQEITLLQILPCTVCCALFAQRRSWPDEIRILVVAGCALAIVALDVGFFQIMCLTALDGVSPNVEAAIGWRFDNPASFFMLIVGYSRLHLVLTAFLIVGFVSALLRRRKVWLCLYIYLFLSILVANLFITLKTLRYEYALIPLWILLSLNGVAECARLLVPTRARFPVRMALAYGWIAIIILSWSPWRLFGSYQQDIIGNSTAALRYVAENLRPGDRVAITQPHPHAALFETGRCDYALAVPILYDYDVRREGQLVDRNGGAPVIGNLDGLQQAFAKNKRLWIVFNRAQTGMFGSKILWQNPAARIQLFLQANSRLVFRSYLWSVYLWDQNAGQYQPFREKPGGWYE
jgi:Dolichyl-phosphate-mannose-protein mannosyltransferase